MKIREPKWLTIEKPFGGKLLNKLFRNYIDHRFENSIPSIRVFESRIGEHASVPTNMFHVPILKIFKPIPRTFGDV